MSKASNTRHTILEKAFDLIYKKGYQTTSIDEIIATTKVTKGAFYYHFKTKDDMGLAIINEIVKPTMHEEFILPLESTNDPLDNIYNITESLLLKNEYLTIEFGCPAGNLTQEMAPWNVEFSNALNEIILEWQSSIEESLQLAIEKGSIQTTVNPKQVALFVIAGYWGIRNYGKLAKNIDCYHTYLEELKRYLNQLK
ncbi:TetR/AcrR family transcriptional regulator [Crocinitomix catalasitica]|uniref:TetR/AcrR family transcriptional regulator n=1 Tax=Crocinitomix catalasitica TaxID=184607 RepID=UPI000482FA0D|nr:TetR/AcrR family transcriptional regulator [Crocinitomix catalasitica]